MRTKEPYIHQLFDSIANYYDLANTVLSFGRDRYWRKFTAELVRDYGAKQVLDICTGTGKLSLAIAREIADSQIIGIDFSEEMIKQGQKHLSTHPEGERIQLRYGNAMNLEFDQEQFDCATLAFSLRNVDDIPHVLTEMKRVVRQGGIVISLELSKPEHLVFKKIYYTYFYRLVPQVGKLIHGKRGPYDYLPASLIEFPDRLQLEEVFRQVGLTNVRSYPLTGGIVAVHVGEKSR